MGTMAKFTKIKTDPKMLALTDEILSQNRRILEMNGELLKAIMSPPIIYDASIGDIDTLKPGRIV